MSTDVYPEDLRLLHWTVVILIAFQYLTGPIMAEAFEAGLEAATPGTGSGIVHAALGIGIFFVMAWRLRARRAQALPAPPRSEPPMLRTVSRGVHLAFYAFLLVMPVFGALALLTGWGFIGALHALAARVLWLLILAHISGAVLHWIARDGVMGRMIGHQID